MATPARVRYTFSPRPSRGVLLGLGVSQLIAAAVGVSAGVLLVDATGNVGIALVPVVAAAAFSLVPLAGRPLHEWARPVVTHGWRVAGGSTRWTAHLPLVRSGGGGAEDGPSVPPELAGLRIVEADDQGRPAGLVVAEGRGVPTYTGVLAVGGSEFSLLQPEEQERRVAAWGDVLAGCARDRSTITRVQWVERAVPDPGTEQGRYLAENLAADPDDPVAAAYLELVRAAGASATRHEAYVALQVAPRPGRRVRGQDPREAALAEVVSELRLLAGRLQSAELAVGGPLSPVELARVLRESFDPAARELLGARAVSGDGSSPAPRNATPLARQTGWDHYRTEDAWHATYWVAEWPRLEVGADWLAPLMLVRTAGIRTVAVTMEPVPPAVAVRRVERDVLGHDVDAQQRSRWGFATTARHTREHEGAVRREQELVTGYVDLRFAGFVSVTAADREQLDAACRDVEQAAVQSHLDLRRLYGQQAEAFVATLPVCAGLARPGLAR